MKKLILLCFLLIACAESNHIKAQKQQGVFNSLAIGISGSTAGIGIDVSSPIGSYFALRAGISFMPNFKFSSAVDVDFSNEYPNVPSISSIDVKGELGRTTGELLLNIYPISSASFFLCGGAYFGGNKLIKIKGHSDELQQFIVEGGKAGIEIGDYSIPVDENGNISGGIKVSSFRPYLGLGFGRAIPRHRIGFMFELGLQFHKVPEVYAKEADLTSLNEVADNSFSDIINNLTIYPVVKFRLCGRIF